MGMPWELGVAVRVSAACQSVMLRLLRSCGCAAQDWVQPAGTRDFAHNLCVLLLLHDRQVCPSYMTPPQPCWGRHV
jgi:hypothetical protein